MLQGCSGVFGPAGKSLDWVGTSYMIPIVYRDIDFYSVLRLSYSVPRYLSYLCVLGTRYTVRRGTL